MWPGSAPPPAHVFSSDEHSDCSASEGISCIISPRGIGAGPYKPFALTINLSCMSVVPLLRIDKWMWMGGKKRSIYWLVSEGRMEWHAGRRAWTLAPLSKFTGDVWGFLTVATCIFHICVCVAFITIIRKGIKREDWLIFPWVHDQKRDLFE